MDSLTPSDCPFCAIAIAHPPSSTSTPQVTPSTSSQQAYVLLSIPLLIAFLDHAPISRGHVLITTRYHREKLSDVSIEEGQALGAWMGVLSRTVLRVALGRQAGTKAGAGREASQDDEVMGDWNIVQNNGTYSILDKVLILSFYTLSVVQPWLIPHPLHV
jgi:diadenosine tetraphosphate (Ap4A) HIT family hydrolase